MAARYLRRGDDPKGRSGKLVAHLRERLRAAPTLVGKNHSSDYRGRESALGAATDRIL